MRKDTRSELQMLRELTWLMLTQYEATCMLCHEPLLLRPNGMTFGHRRHPKIPVRFTVHHVDHDRTNNQLSNLAIVHSGCHKKYHAEDDNAEEDA